MVGMILKIGELVKGEPFGDIKIIIATGQKIYSPTDNTSPCLCEVLFFEDGTWDWKRNWRRLQWWDK